VNPARAILAGNRDPETVDALAADLARWIGSDGTIPLHRFLSLGTPKRERTILRNAGLRAALDMVAAPSRHKRCEILAERIRAFEVRRWSRWEHLASPPADATDLDRILWRCRQVDQLPESVEQLLRITGTFCASDDSGPAAKVRSLEEQTSCT